MGLIKVQGLIHRNGVIFIDVVYDEYWVLVGCCGIESTGAGDN